MQPERVLRPSANETRERILLTAERLFAERGFPAVAVRDIAREASVDPALVNYHFGGKQALLETALLARAEDFMAEREAALAACIAEADGSPSLSAVIIAYTRPYLVHAQSDDPGWRNWFKLLAKAVTAPDWAPSVFREHFDPFVRNFIQALKVAAPGAPEERYYWCYHFFSGGLILTFADTGRIDNLSQGQCQSGDLVSGYHLLVPFFAAGCEAILRGEHASMPPLAV